MLTNSRLMTKGAWLPIALIVALSCKQGPSPEAQARIDSLSQASAQKDRLVEEIAENTRFVSEISAELAKAAVPPKKLKVSSESPLRASRDTLIQKIRYITARVREIEPKLQDSERRISELTSISDSLRNALAATVWTDPTLSAGATMIKAVHILELRTALNQVYTKRNLALPVYTDPTLAAGTPSKAAHIQELRNFVSALP